MQGDNELKWKINPLVFSFSPTRKNLTRMHNKKSARQNKIKGFLRGELEFPLLDIFYEKFSTKRLFHKDFISKKLFKSNSDIWISIDLYCELIWRKCLTHQFPMKQPIYLAWKKWNMRINCKVSLQYWWMLPNLWLTWLPFFCASAFLLFLVP